MIPYEMIERMNGWMDNNVINIIRETYEIRSYEETKLFYNRMEFLSFFFAVRFIVFKKK